jgi:hypothetical protein
MIVNAQTRPYRRQAKTMGIHQRVAANHADEMSVPLRRAVIIALCTALFLVVACGQFLHWRIMSGHQAVTQLQSASSALSVENINLLATRARLMSSEHIEAVAAVRLDLHVPGKGQVHRL